jgi:hypothetical protein
MRLPSETRHNRRCGSIWLGILITTLPSRFPVDLAQSLCWHIAVLAHPMCRAVRPPYSSGGCRGFTPRSFFTPLRAACAVVCYVGS